MTLTNANSYTGSTTVEAGTLSLGHASALGNSSSVLLQNNATLEVADVNALGTTPVTITGNATINTVGSLADPTQLNGVISGSGDPDDRNPGFK